MIRIDDTREQLDICGVNSPWRIVRERIVKRNHDRVKCLADEIGKEERIQGHIKRIRKEMKRAKHRKHEADQHDAIRQLCRHRDGA